MSQDEYHVTITVGGERNIEFLDKSSPWRVLSRSFY